LWYPKDKIIHGQETQRLLKNGFSYFYELFTKRNLLALSLLLSFIKKSSYSEKIKEILLFVFSSLLRGSNRMCFKPEKWQGGSPSDWPGHAYWVPLFPLEWPVWDYFVRCYKKVFKGKEFSGKEIGGFYKKALRFSDLKRNNTCLLFAIIN
jgi:hypothetical protein